MAQLKDTIISGLLRVTDALFTKSLQTQIIKAPSSSGGTTYTAGANGQIIKSNGTTVYWAADNNTTYSANNGVSLSGTTFSNSGVRSIATGSANGTISVNTNGTSADVAVKGLGTAAYTASTAYATSGHTHNYAGSSSAGGAATSLANFENNKNSGKNANNVLTNAHTYYTSNGPATSLGASATDGALYSQAYSDSWVAQIAQDYRNGNLFTRGKNNGTWQDWKAVSYLNPNIYYVKGTQTATTGAWTGVLSDVSALYEGLTIAYWLPFNGNGNATLELTLKGGGTTGAVDCYYSSTSRLTTHIAANNILILTYQTVTISGTSYTGWWMVKTYDGNDLGIHLRATGSNYVADSVVYRYQLLFQKDVDKLTPLNNVDNGYNNTSKTMLTNVEFDPFGKIYYWNNGSTVNANGALTAGGLYFAHAGVDLRYTFNTGTTLTANKDFYLKVSMQTNGMAKIASASPWAQTLPTSNDGYCYIFLGRTLDNYRIALFHDHPVYYHDGTGVKELTKGHSADTATHNMITSSSEQKMVATKNYSSGNLMIANNKLYRATASIASGATLTVGSNVAEVNLEGLIIEKANQTYVSKLPYVSNTTLYNNTADYHNAVPRGKDITSYFTNGSLWNRINGSNGYSLFEDLYVGDYLTAGGQVYVIVDFDYYYRAALTANWTTHHIIMMPKTVMDIPEGTVLYGGSDTLTLINTTNAGVTVSSEETNLSKKWYGTMSSPNTSSTKGGYKYSRMRQVIMKAADTIVTNAFGAAHVQKMPAAYRDASSATASGLDNSYGNFTENDWSSDLRRSICDLPNAMQILGLDSSYLAESFQVENGVGVFTQTIYDHVSDKYQFSLFKNCRDAINVGYAYTLRNVSSKTRVLYIAAKGGFGSLAAATAYNVRPRFILIG